jgi:hypothetical protein
MIAMDTPLAPLPLTITNPTLTTSKTYDGTTTAHVVVGTLNGVTT